MRFCGAIFFCVACTHAFAPSSRSRPESRLYSDKFNVAKPVFDLFSLRQIRGDALAKYNSLNQSEPLRINLSALASLSLLVFPSLATEVNGEPLSTPQTAVSIGASLGSALFFVRECQKRSKQLTRLEKELYAPDLPLRLPTNALADQPFQKPMTIRQLQKANGSRIVAITGTAKELDQVVQDLQILGRRLVQASTVVLLVPKDESYSIPRHPWLAQASEREQWLAYFDSLSDSSSSFKWFGLSSSGRSFGSGQEADVSWLQLMGQHLRPTSILDEDDRSEESELIERQQEFYKALTEGNLNDMEKIYSPSKNVAVSTVIEQGGRLDSWKTCLEDGNRPEGMKVADGDVTLVDDRTAWTTAIEFPALIEGATLLAVQQWVKEDGTWKISKHQTIPWADIRAAGTLICDCRGCVSLTRGAERRTFGGIIG